jgi:hypothetical protein
MLFLVVDRIGCSPASHKPKQKNWLGNFPKSLRGFGLKQTLPAVFTALAVCLGYVGALSMPGPSSGSTSSAPAEPSFENSKTDFISIAVFEGAKVRGYISFRVAFSISDADRVPEVGFIASDIAIRTRLTVSDIGTNLPALAKKLESKIKTHLEGKFPAEQVKSIQIADFGFDARI